MPDDMEGYYVSKSLRMPKDATVGSVNYNPPTLSERISGSGPRSVLALGTMLPMAGAEAMAPAAARFLMDRRVNAMFSPQQKAFWEMFGKRATDVAK